MTRPWTNPLTILSLVTFANRFRRCNLRLAMRNFIARSALIAELIESIFRTGNKLMIAGNGGSAGDAQTSQESSCRD